MTTTASLPTTPFPEGQATAYPAHSGPHTPADTDTTRGFAITSFVLGIASVISGWTFVVPVVGLVFGIVALRRKTTERTLALWGVWLNAGLLALSALIILAFVAVVAFGLVALPFIA